MARLSMDIAAAWEQEGMAQGERRPVIGAVDAPCLQRLMLGCMDRASGSVLMEEVAVDRRDDTGYDLAKTRLTTLGTGVLSLVSDRAKALVTLAQTGLGCPSIPEVLPLRHALATGETLASVRRLRHATQALEQAPQRLKALQGSPRDRNQAQQAQASVKAGEASGHHWQGGRSAWRQPLAHLSRILHPWRLGDATCQTSQDVARQGHAELHALETLRETNGVPVKKDTGGKVRTPRAGVAVLVDCWGQTVRQDVAHLAMPPRWPPWVAEGVLPLMSWHAQRSRTRCPVHKAQIALVLQAVAEACARHACPRTLSPEVLAGWNAWAAAHTRALQRASSAVEGRHGSLAQRPHTHRGVPRRRDQVWTVWHTVDCRATDGTTPASRCFRRSFPDLCARALAGRRVAQAQAAPLGHCGKALRV